MPDLYTHIAGILSKHPQEWTDSTSGARVVMPEPSAAWVAEVTQKVMAEVVRHRSEGYGPASGRVSASELRRPDLPGIRQPGDDLGEEVPPA